METEREDVWRRTKKPKRSEEDAGRVCSERELILTTRKLRYGKGALLYAVAFSL